MAGVPAAPAQPVADSGGAGPVHGKPTTPDPTTTTREENVMHLVGPDQRLQAKAPLTPAQQAADKVWADYLLRSRAEQVAAMEAEGMTRLEAQRTAAVARVVDTILIGGDGQ